MLQKASTVALLGVLVAWLVLSYWPAAAAVLPVIAFSSSMVVDWLPALVIGVLVIVAAIQLWLVYATTLLVRKPSDATQAATLRQFNLQPGNEVLLTIAPLLITGALAALIWLG